ncbi:hypothetical protein [Caulobacter sp. DWP3-1-3b2]|uniref:hypothetical protein n=1 Tax=Caulobacter sp. DWP3-1-3b2 TaxID=2804643 RepID=UPI003CEF0909
MLTDDEIKKAIAARPFKRDANHEHPDCVRIAYAWLDAQKKTRGPTRRSLDLKHIIENWALRYVSESDVQVAAAMHPDITGQYPYFNISSRLTKPSHLRLESIGEAGKHTTYGSRYTDVYALQEE